MFNFLKKVPLFANLPEEDLERLCLVVTEEHVPAERILFTEGEIGDKAYVIMSGEIEILKESGGHSVQLATRRTGEVIGEMSLLDQTPRFATGRTLTDSVLLAISHENLSHLLDTSPSAARVMLSTITNRLRSTELVLRQSEKMAQLGTLTAGIAHELNNPASAVRRGSEHLQTNVEQFQETYRQFVEAGLSPQQWEMISKLQAFAKKRASQPLDLDNLGRSDLEYELEEWLDANGVENGWDHAPILVNLGYQSSDLEQLKEDFPGRQLEITIRWLCSSYSIFSLLEEVHQGTSRIGDIVRSMKSYVYLDQAQIQMVDIHEGLDNTLVMLRSKLKHGVNVERHYDENIPKIQAYGSELNQVWTNIIDNAVDAMDGNGKLSLTTHQDGDWVVVEIEDSGPGIPQEVQDKLFSPFFTTKPVGKGTGLGLNISFNIIQKHSGSIKVFSRPGKTCFYVRLPLNFEEVEKGLKSLPGVQQLSDDRLRKILTETKTIAVVGMTNRKTVPAYTVPAYLLEAGYTIIPVTPKYDEVMGLKTFPDLLSIKRQVDLVLVFRRSDFVPEIVRQAVEIGAKVVWMQEGISNPDAAAMAQDAGLEVVMDNCMRKTHQRLILKAQAQ